MAARVIESSAATLQAQGNCAFSAGNLCLAQCGVVTNMCNDQADFEEDGYWLATAIIPIALQRAARTRLVLTTATPRTGAETRPRFLM